MIAVSGLRLPPGLGEPEAVAEACRRCGVAAGGLRHGALRRVSYDARHGRVVMVCSVLLSLEDARLERALAESRSDVAVVEKHPLRPQYGHDILAHRPLIAGFGPAGMFAALLLAEHGYRPVVLERGGDMAARVRAVDGFFAGGALDPECNVQFGEGGAGTFSDGKLTTRISDPLCDFVLETFVKYGAPDSVLTRAKPHVGTDLLRGIVTRIRTRICALGGEVRFSSRLEDVAVKNGALRGARVSGETLDAEALLVCCGHSARDTFEMLGARGASLEAKAFSVGFRIEHLQSDIDRAVYGRAAGSPHLPRAEYALSARSRGRGVYTFCMCPGGTVVAAASEAGGAVTNGMSDYARAGKNANSAVAVSVDERDFGRDPFRALEFQRELERRAFSLGGGGFRAPAQDLGSFMDGADGLRAGRVEPSYPRGVTPCGFAALFGEELTACLREGIVGLGQRLRGFDDREAALTGAETRTSSPVRILRGENREAAGIAGIYPCGEGSGYAGGITSAAVDGLKTALALMGRYKPF